MEMIEKRDGERKGNEGVGPSLTSYLPTLSLPPSLSHSLIPLLSCLRVGSSWIVPACCIWSEITQRILWNPIHRFDTEAHFWAVQAPEATPHTCVQLVSLRRCQFSFLPAAAISYNLVRQPKEYTVHLVALSETAFEP